MRTQIKKRLSFFMLVVIVSATLNIDAAVAGTSPQSTTATVTLTVNQAITLSGCTAGTWALGTLDPGTSTPASGDLTCNIDSNANGGVDFAIRRNDATGTIRHTDTTTYLADKTAWTPGTPNGAVWSGTGLGFRVKSTGTTGAAYNSTWWGTDDTAPNAKYAGFPTAYANIAVTSSYSAATINVVMNAKADAAATQKSGSYSGIISVQGTTKP